MSKKKIILNGFVMNVVTHLSAGLWRHPNSNAVAYNSLKYWTDLATILEEGGFDVLFVADALGVPDVFEASRETYLKAAAQVPVNDPLLLVSAMAAATRHLGFGITVSSTYEYPYLLARKFSTLDHVTEGRVGWNIVTSHLESAARNLGLEHQIDHDERYDRAQEFMDVTYKLWEGSWEDDAVVRDAERNIYADPAKVHAIEHEGRYYHVPGVHISEPSSQRTPVLFQAGTSERGREFAAQNAEVVFLAGVNTRSFRKAADAIRQRARELGRPDGSIKFIAALSVITAPTEAEAQEKFREYASYGDKIGALALFSAWSGIDWSKFPPDYIIKDIETNASKSIISTLTEIDAERNWTVGDIAEYVSVGGMHPKIVGTPERVVDEMERMIDEAGIDGFNVNAPVMPGTFQDFISLIIPELRKRGRLREREAKPVALRQRIFRDGSRLHATHRGARFRPMTSGPSSSETRS